MAAMREKTLFQDFQRSRRILLATARGDSRAKTLTTTSDSSTEWRTRRSRSHLPVSHASSSHLRDEYSVSVNKSASRWRRWRLARRSSRRGARRSWRPGMTLGMPAGYQIITLLLWDIMLNKFTHRFSLRFGAFVLFVIYFASRCVYIFCNILDKVRFKFCNMVLLLNFLFIFIFYLQLKT
jgi:hypothetical protein